ncbi:MAG: GNAT family N-acetyltransferase [Huintestinicola sp.]|uniref:GNAT family N-acetyltransferase n=1 Tax=Huintestinicola sp. TaxID=2981661 RepID=UPI003F0F7D0D
MNVYEKCPVLENENFLLRSVEENDVQDLLSVYSDEKAVPFFNSDNCNGDDFHYTTATQMKQAIDFWLFSYKEKYFVRWSVVDKKTDTAVGTVELFNRRADDFFNNCGLLRLDLRSDYEKADIISDILGIIISPAYELFDCDIIASKAIPAAKERIAAFERYGFTPADEKLIGHDETEYGDYFVLRK